MWCESFTIHAKYFNKCLHPHHCFRKGVKDPKSFTVGNGIDDAPGTFSTNVKKDEKLIQDVLNSVFETNTSKHLTVQAHNGQGYEASFQIIAKGHPAIAEESPKPVFLCRPI